MLNVPWQAVGRGGSREKAFQGSALLEIRSNVRVILWIRCALACVTQIDGTSRPVDQLELIEQQATVLMYNLWLRGCLSVRQPEIGRVSRAAISSTSPGLGETQLIS